MTQIEDEEQADAEAKKFRHVSQPSILSFFDNKVASDHEQSIVTISAGGDGSNQSAHISLLINTFDEMEDSGCTQESCLHNRKSGGAPQEVTS